MSPEAAAAWGLFVFPGVSMDVPEDFMPVTAAEAARRLRRKPVTIRAWARRYGARQLGSDPLDKRKVFYDYLDLALIEREIAHGHEVPPTPEARAAIRSGCPLREAEREAERAFQAA